MQLHTSEDIEILGEQLHDGWVDLDSNLQADPAGTLLIDGWLETDQMVIRWRLGPFVVVRAVTARFQVVLQNVIDATVRDGSETGGISVSKVTYDSGSGVLGIEGHNDCDLTVTMTSLAGEFNVDHAEAGVSTSSTVMLRRSLPPMDGKHSGSG